MELQNHTVMFVADCPGLLSDAMAEHVGDSKRCRCKRASTMGPSRYPANRHSVLNIVFSTSFRLKICPDQQTISVGP